MINFSKIRNVATAAVGALVISTACVAAAVGPAASVERNAEFAANAQPSVQANA
jgi:hypothetical protein